MATYKSHPLEIILCLWRNKELVKALVKRDVLSRYRGSALGLLWSFFNPLLMLGVYTFVFSEVFKGHWGVGGDSKTEFALVLFAGLIVFNLFAECINRAPSLILGNPNYVKKVVFPLEILPFVNLLSAFYHALVSLAVWLLVYIVLFGVPHLTIVLLPLIIVPFSLLIMGLSWALASLGVYLRDVTQFIGVLTTMLMFLSAIFYPVSALPESYQQIIYLNPLVPVIEMTRDVLYWGKGPDFFLLAIYWLITSMTAYLGFAWFQKTRNGFADVV